ncbi:lipoxygenase 2.2, chloroplastic [Aegilops tauschii subsp. strangulata]|uniref:lipoxygenase 2.2, chloroplastic n=1 Tax=Aegilops tauschii subsp. strangulata TaxID=200361 RepID=UPI00098B5317|nr:lipoxygenase 2.2, chloroplastic [Aegilops tauschii subsp. strangulata]
MVIMQTATRPLVGAHGAPFARRAALVPKARRQPGSPRRTSKIGSSSTSSTTTTTTNLSEANGPATSTVARPDLHFDLNQAVELRATVTVNMKNFWLKEDMLDQALDVFHNLFTQNWLYLELVSSELDPKTGQEWDVVSGKVQHSRSLEEDWHMYDASFMVPASFGPIGAVQVKNYHYTEMLLGDIKVFPAGENSGSSAVALFHCNSWINPSQYSPEKRSFFPLENSYLPSQTPKGVERLRESELVALRGTGYGERKAYDRIYDYDVYNDLGDPCKDKSTNRPVLGGKEHPYPRRCRTGRPHCRKYPLSETIPPKGVSIYVPEDENFTERKELAFNTKLFMSLLHGICRIMKRSKHSSQSFPTLEAINAMYDDEFRNQPLQPDGGKFKFIAEFLEKEALLLFEKEGAEFLEGIRRVFEFETPEIHDRDKYAWFRDEEFARETLAGVNPLSIQLVRELPLVSKLDEKIYGPADSLITKEVIEEQINGVMTAEEAVAKKKLFMLDYHDLYLPFVNKVRQLEGTTLYGSRALFFLAGDGTLRPIAIELTRPKSASKPQWREVFTPASGHKASITGSWQWQLAKAHVVCLDTGYHQLVSHWLRTHCCVEPYIIAANRQLSQMHPIYRLLAPSFRFTMEINAQARKLLINADGIIESTFSPGKYSMEISSAAYAEQWQFDKEALPEDLIRRGMAVRGEDGKLELAIEDYPYANDGLLVWDAIKQWASDYVAHYYACAADIVDDVELQAWWKEVRTKGHADKKDEPWWPHLDCHESLVQTLSTIMWVASAHHAAVNFSQYPYGGYVPNRPSIARINMPSEIGPDGMRAYMEAPDKVLLDTFPSQYQSALVMAILDVLSSHSSGEEYLGTYQEPAWQQNGKINNAFEDFRERMLRIAVQVNKWNRDPERKNRCGPGMVPYVQLRPSDGDPMAAKTVMGMGVPTSISI